MAASSAQRQDAWYYDEKIVSGYESWYEGKYKRADALEKRLLHTLLKDVGEVHSLLEVGCGTTHFTRWFAALGLEAMGLDISHIMLRTARTMWDGELAQGVSSHLPFVDDSFDLVAFIACMEYMPDVVGVLREAERVARKGLLIGLMNRWSLPTLRRMIQVRLGRNPYYKDAHFYSIREMKKRISEAFDGMPYRLGWRTSVYPRPIPLEDTVIPFGAFLGISVALDKGGVGLARDAL